VIVSRRYHCLYSTSLTLGRLRRRQGAPRHRSERPEGVGVCSGTGGETAEGAQRLQAGTDRWASLDLCAVRFGSVRFGSVRFGGGTFVLAGVKKCWSIFYPGGWKPVWPLGEDGGFKLSDAAQQMCGGELRDSVRCMGFA